MQMLLEALTTRLLLVLLLPVVVALLNVLMQRV
jgi:hypothetical protein